MCGFRLQGLEKKVLTEASETPAVVYEMKKQVDSFREKLEVKHQLWLPAAPHTRRRRRRTDKRELKSAKETETEVFKAKASLMLNQAEHYS